LDGINGWVSQTFVISVLWMTAGMGEGRRGNTRALEAQLACQTHAPYRTLHSRMKIPPAWPHETPGGLVEKMGELDRESPPVSYVFRTDEGRG